MVIIRGGGDEVDFDVFNDLNVIDSWISLPSFRISAIGHSKDRTYLDIFSDRSCDTPTAAAVGIREEIEKIRLKQGISQIIQDFQAKEKELNQKIQELKTKLSTERLVIVALLILFIIIFLIKNF